MQTREKIFILIFATVMILFTAYSVQASQVNPANVIYSRLPADNQGPDEVFTIPQYNLVCVYKGNSLVCLCPCTAGLCPVTVESTNVPATGVPVITATQKPVDPTATTTVVPTVVPTNTPIPTNTPVPTATLVPTTPNPNGVLIRHYDADGTVVWEKCMPTSAWNGHRFHKGHLIQDDNLGYCYR